MKSKVCAIAIAHVGKKLAIEEGGGGRSFPLHVAR